MSNEQNNSNFSAKAAQLAQLAKGIAETAKGAVAGGVKGAAIAAAKNFAPQIIKVVAIIVLSMLLLPAIIFFALPNIFFQMPSVGDADVRYMTEQSMRIEEIYSRMGSLTQAEADKIIAELSAGFDETVVTSDFHNINRDWLIAISTVFHNQSLEIGENDVRQLLRSNIEYSYTTESWQERVGEDEDGNPVYETRTRINISIWNTEHDRLMDALGFTRFQRDWAYFLYENISVPQLNTPESDTGSPGNLPNYGDLVFSNGGRDVVYHHQADARWGHYMHCRTYTIAVAGCGPTALAMVVSTLTGTMINPKEMTDWSSANGFVAQGSGSYHALIPNGARHFGLNVTGATAADGQRIINALAEGKLVIALMGPGHFTVSGHFIVLRGVTSEGKVLVSDPISIRKTNMEWDMRIILSEASRRATAGGPFWIFDL